jgi:hypothetical protein
LVELSAQTRACIIAATLYLCALATIANHVFKDSGGGIILGFDIASVVAIQETRELNLEANALGSFAAT